MEGDSGGFGGASDGPDPAGDYGGGGSSSDGPSDAGAPGQTAPDANGLPGLAPLETVEIASQPVAHVSLDPVTSVDLGALFSNTVNTLLGVLGIASGTPAGVLGGSKAVMSGVNAPSAFSTSLVESVSFGTSSAPSSNPTGAEGPSIASAGFTGAADQGNFSGVEGSAVMGFGGVTVNQAPGTDVFSTGGGSVQAPAGLAALLGSLAYPQGRYGAPRAAAAAAPQVPGALLLAGLASFLFIG